MNGEISVQKAYIPLGERSDQMDKKEQHQRPCQGAAVMSASGGGLFGVTPSSYQLALEVEYCQRLLRYDFVFSPTPIP